MAKVKRFSRKMLCNIEDLHAKGYFIPQIARKLKIPVSDVHRGLDKIYEAEEKQLVL